MLTELFLSKPVSNDFFPDYFLGNFPRSDTRHGAVITPDPLRNLEGSHMLDEEITQLLDVYREDTRRSNYRAYSIDFTIIHYLSPLLQRHKFLLFAGG